MAYRADLSLVEVLFLWAYLDDVIIYWVVDSDLIICWGSVDVECTTDAGIDNIENNWNELTVWISVITFYISRIANVFEVDSS